MVFPMMMPFIGSGYYYSASNYDLCSTNPWNMMNLFFNQMFAGSITETYLYNAPAWSFNNSYPYPSSGFDTFNSMLNPANYVQNCPFFRPTNPTGGGGSGATCNDAPNEAARIKYNKLLSLMKAIEQVSGLETDVKAGVSVAIRNTSGSYVERYNALKTAYDKVDDNIVKKAIIEKGDLIGVTDEISEKSDEDSFKNRLSKAGFEYTGTDMDTKVSTFKGSFDSINSENWKAEDAANIVKDIKEKGTILDFISSWNSTYAGDTNRILKHIKTQVNSATSKEETFKAVKQDVITPLCDALIVKAKELNTANDSTIQNYIDELDNKCSSLTENTFDDLIGAFDNLYAKIRLVAIEKIETDAINYYKEIDNVVFTNNFFKDYVVEDLTSEGFEVNVPKKAANAAAEAAEEEEENGGASSEYTVVKKDTNNAERAEQDYLNARGGDLGIG